MLIEISHGDLVVAVDDVVVISRQFKSCHTLLSCTTHRRGATRLGTAAQSDNLIFWQRPDGAAKEVLKGPLLTLPHRDKISC